MNILERETSLGLKKIYEKTPNFVCKRILDASSFNYKCPSQPGDFDGVHSGKAFIIECKSTKKPRFYLSQIREHQYDDMIEYSLAGANSWFLLSYRNTRDVKYACISVIDLFNIIMDSYLEKGNIPASFSYDELINQYHGIPLYISHDEHKVRYINFDKLFTNTNTNINQVDLDIDMDLEE